MALWGGRFSGETNERVAELSESVSFDQRLYAHDVVGSIAHVKMLAATAIIPQDDADAIVGELTKIKKSIDKGKFKFNTALEDIHMNIESALIDKLGDSGARVHTARSRNDQVATDIRLYLRDEIDNIRTLIQTLQSAVVSVADANIDAIMPGFTHLQNAQPVLVAHHLLAYVEMLERDIGRLRDCRSRINNCPLGSGALAGTTLPIDRVAVAEELGFDGVTRNSMDAVSDRDFMIELLSALSIVMMHLSRLSEDIILWMSQSYGFVNLDDTFCTGSSLMPQKKNPDVAELTRGKTGRVYGALTSMLTVMKGLPMCYNRDMQEDKEPVFDAIDTVKLVLAVYAPMVGTMTFNTDKMLAAASDPALMATDLAEYLVKKGMPFRTAHHRVGAFVGWCEKKGIGLDEATLRQMKRTIPEADKGCLELFNPESSVNARNSYGGTGPSQVRKQLEIWKEQLYGIDDL
jgi:argininosuccinate lyase